MKKLVWILFSLSVVAGQIPPNPQPPPNSFPVGGPPPPPPGPGPIGPVLPPPGPLGPPRPVGPVGPPFSPEGLNTFGPEALEWRCPQHWVQFQGSCYRFIKSPIRPRHEARRNCQAYNFLSDLVNINSLEEHGFLLNQLNIQDPQRRRWYTSGFQQQPNFWINEGDGSPIVNLEAAFLPQPPPDQPPYNRDFLAYSYSTHLMRWGFERASGIEPLLYICEAPIGALRSLLEDDRTYTYGVDIEDPLLVPRGPIFIRQPKDVVFDLSKRKLTNDVTLSCLATGYPTPSYEWYKEDYENDVLRESLIDPLQDNRYTISGGSLIIYNPNQITDRGTYHCKATNRFGTIVSESVQLSFGFVGEFNLKRSPEQGDKNWGKAVYCDPPQYFPGVTYYWARDYFPNFVEEDRRVFSSFDGALYFSALENIDQGNYSCNVQSKVSDTGRNGPFFRLNVRPHPNYQQLKFPNNFPKAFPEALIAGHEARLECVAFGYPVPNYNWTRVNANLPRGAYMTNYNRVLIIPSVQVEDQGEYVCRASNDRAAITNSVIISIQAEPNFTVPLIDKHMDFQGNLTWTCEAFGIPDVTYNWLRNGQILDVNRLPPEDWGRYHIQDNVLTIERLDPYRDQAMYQCRARNQLRTRYSSAQLRVLSLAPSFKKRPLETETYAAEGGNVTMRCNPEAAPRPRFIWKKDRNILGSGGRRIILENGNMVIKPVSRDDEGVYSCTAENAYGRDQSYGRLIVLRGPRFVRTMPPSFVTTEGSDIALTCDAYSDEMLDVAYIWTHNGLRIRDERNQQIRIKVDGNLLAIRNASLAEAGDYECIVKSVVGRISTRTRVIVEGPPGPPGGVQVVDVKKTSATIQWTDGAPNGQPIYVYIISARTTYNDTWLNITSDVRAREIDRNNGRKQFELEGMLSPGCTYEFRVAAANQHGYGVFSGPSPQYRTPPDRPYKFPAKVGGGGGKIGDLTITWTPLPPQDQNGPGIYYKVFWRRTEHDTEFQSLALKDQGNIGMAVVRIQSEFFYTKYDVKVQAVNDIGYGPESKIRTIYSAEDMPHVAPQQVSARSFNSTALNVTWSPVEQTREKIRGKLIGYRLKYWIKDQKEEDAVYYLSRSLNSWSLIVGLMPDTHYIVKVMAFNAAGEGPESERFYERTFRKAPQKPPSSVHIYGVNPSTVRVEWRYVAPSLDEEPVSGYKVRVWEKDRDMSTANDTIIRVGRKLEAYITNLSPGKSYHMRVLAFSNGGDGRMSSPALTFQMGDREVLRSGVGSTTSSLLVVLHSALFAFVWALTSDKLI